MQNQTQIKLLPCFSVRTLLILVVVVLAYLACWALTRDAAYNLTRNCPENLLGFPLGIRGGFSVVKDEPRPVRKFSSPLPFLIKSEYRGRTQYHFWFIRASNGRFGIKEEDSYLHSVFVE